MKKLLKKKQGITLIALVITIVIIVILAAVSINMLIGDEKIIKKETRYNINSFSNNNSDNSNLSSSKHKYANRR